MATSVGRLSSVELMPVSDTLAAGGFGVAAAWDPEADGAELAAGAACPHAASTIAMPRSGPDARRMWFPLRAERRGGAPAQQSRLHPLGDLHQRDREDHEDEEYEIDALGIEKPRGDVEPVAEAGRGPDELADHRTGEREAHARPEGREDPAEHRGEHDEAGEVRAAPAHHLHRLDQLRIDRADAEIRVEEDDEEHREEAEGDLRRDPEPEERQEDRRDRDPRQRVERNEHGLDDLRGAAEVRETQAERRAADDAEHEPDHRFGERRREVPPEQARLRVGAQLAERARWACEDRRAHEDDPQAEPPGHRLPQHEDRDDERRAAKGERPGAAHAFVSVASRNSSRSACQMVVSSRANSAEPRSAKASRG